MTYGIRLNVAGEELSSSIPPGKKDEHRYPRDLCSQCSRVCATRSRKAEISCTEFRRGQANAHYAQMMSHSSCARVVINR